MIAKRQTNYGGNRAGRTARSAFPNERTRVTQTGPLQARRSPGPLAHCKVCGLDVGVHADGTLRPHRVGSKLAGRWPCPGGADVYVGRTKMRDKRVLREAEILADIIREEPGAPQLYKTYPTHHGALCVAGMLNSGHLLGFPELEFIAEVRGCELWITYTPKEK